MGMIRSRHPRKRIAALAVLIFVIGGCIVLEHYAGGQAGRIVKWVHGLGSFGPLAFMGLNALGVICFLPQMPFSLAAGLLFGWMWGTAYSLVGMGVGAVAAFLLARYGLRWRLIRHFGDEPMFRRMRELSRTRPWHMLAISRFVPVFHYALASYLLGVTEVRLLPFLIMSVACLVPETLLLASGGNVVMVGLLHGLPHPLAVAMLALAAVVFAVAILLLVRKVRSG